MNNFNIKRFGRLCLLRITERQRILGLLVLLTFVALLTVKVACAVKFFWNGDLAVRLSHIGDISRLIAYAGMGYLMTLFVDKVMRREDGIRFFMLPATNLERFLSLVVLPLVSFVVIWTVTWFAAELIWCLTLDNFFPDVYNIYLNVTDRGQNLLAFYAILVIVFSGIITPMEVISGPGNNIRSIILFIGFIPLHRLYSLFGSSFADVSCDSLVIGVEVADSFDECCIWLNRLRLPDEESLSQIL